MVVVIFQLMMLSLLILFSLRSVNRKLEDISCYGHEVMITNTIIKTRLER